MNKIKAIKSIEESKKEIQNWIDYGNSLLSNGNNMDQRHEPITYNECILGLWIYSDGAQLKGLTWFDNLVSSHEKTHKAYDKLYNETLKIYNPKTFNELHDLFVEIELYSDTLMKLLDEAIKHINELPDEESTGIADTQIDDTHNKYDFEIVNANASDPLNSNPIFPVDTKAHAKENAEKIDIIENIEVEDAKQIEIKKSQTEMTAPESDQSIALNSEVESIDKVAKRQLTQTNKLDLNDPLLSQDVGQLEIKKQFIQLEIDQLKERQKLTAKSVKKLEEFKLLKQKEKEQLQAEINQLEASKQEDLNSNVKILNELIEAQQKKRQELEQMEQVSLKLKQKKTAEKVVEEEQLQSLEQQKQVYIEEIGEIKERKSTQNREIEKLEQQLLQAKQVLEKLDTEEKSKNDKFTLFQEDIQKYKLEIKEESLKRQKINEKKDRVEELKQLDLENLKKEQEKIQEKVKQHEEDLVDIKTKRNDLQIIDQVLAQLTKEHKLNQLNSERLQEEEKQKQQELNQLEESNELVTA